MENGFIIAAPHSGSGKTTITLALLHTLCRQGKKIAAYKIGPDFIDPGHHGTVTGESSHNLDGWLMSKDYNHKLFREHSIRADICVVEGVMGLFDGYGWNSEDGSTGQMAKWLDLPVVLVVDARSMARSVAALLQGFERFDPKIRFAGVMFNRVGSPRHLQYLREAAKNYTTLPVLGGIPRDPAFDLPERHLGLWTAEDHPLSQSRLTKMADILEDVIDFETLLSQTATHQINDASADLSSVGNKSLKVRIAVPRDQAFCFYYQENVNLLRSMGAEICDFSPLIDEELPSGIHGIYLGGGYPELHAHSLSANDRLRTAIRNSALQGMPIYAECGGFMYLCRSLETPNGEIKPMAGVFPFETRMGTKFSALGYRKICFTKGNILGEKDEICRGHEFHYSHLKPDPAQEGLETAFHISSRSSDLSEKEGYMVDNALGS
ncbi:cobyrinate a,c-diamide synthase, partial [Desulfobacterales bacterium HSG17]|nr:cobyrinate a,c-diamide synthase [Desulfobacterales bacterium HSG17]